MKEIYRDIALSAIPKILQLCDRNPYHQTYGCFDRSYWHYKTIDFPSGMYQEYVLPLALVYSQDFGVSTPWYQNERIKELCLAGISFAARSSRADGSCDDYYPYERALGAIAFSLYAMTESVLLIKHSDQALIDFFKKRADYLVCHDETGKLSNHQALAALALFNVWLVTEDEKYKIAAELRLERVLSWQSEEGWFFEYEGSDLGYHTATISFLAQCFKKTQNEKLKEPLKKAIDFASHFIHRDGSYGGEYGSRNTFHYYPYGFEIMASDAPLGTAMNNLYAEGIKKGKQHNNDDDRVFCHLVYDNLQAYLVWSQNREDSSMLPRPRQKHFVQAGLCVLHKKNYQAVVSLHKGGVIKAYSHKKCVLSDLGLIGLDTKKNLFTTQIYHAANPVNIKDDEIEVTADFYKVSDKTFTPFKQIIFRLACLILARFSSNFFRKILQRMVILHKNKYPARLTRRLMFKDDGIEINDRIEMINRRMKVTRLSAGSDHTSIYTAAADSYQDSVLLPWVSFNDNLDQLNQAGVLEQRRVISVG